MQKILIAFNKKGDKVGKEIIPKSFYLITEKDWIQNTLEKSPALDGIAMVLSEGGNITIVRYAE